MQTATMPKQITLAAEPVALGLALAECSWSTTTETEFVVVTAPGTDLPLWVFDRTEAAALYRGVLESEDHSPDRARAEKTLRRFAEFAGVTLSDMAAP